MNALSKRTECAQRRMPGGAVMFQIKSLERRVDFNKCGTSWHPDCNITGKHCSRHGVALLRRLGIELGLQGRAKMRHRAAVCVLSLLVGLSIAVKVKANGESPAGAIPDSSG